MNPALVIPAYIVWHYTTALRDIWGILTNFLWFFWHFFSMPVLLKTMFLSRYKLTTNIFLQIKSFLIRVVVLIFAFGISLAVITIGIVFYALWLVLPLILFLLFFFAIYNFFI